MFSQYELQNHFAITSCQDIAEICKPLYQIDISGFVYIKTINGNRIFLSDSAPWNEHLLRNLFKYQDVYQFEEQLCQNMFISSEIFSTTLGLSEAKAIFGHQNCFIITILTEHYKELYYFVSKRDDSYHDFCLHNLDVLYQFVKYFTEKAKKIIEKASVNQIIIPSNFIPPEKIANFDFNISDSNQKIERFLKGIATNKYYLLRDPYNRYLTQREYECIKWLILGKSADEIGMILGISRRTVEDYIKNIKFNFNCRKITRLIYHLTKLGLVI